MPLHLAPAPSPPNQTKSNQIIKSKPNQSLHGNPRLLALGSMAADLIESFSILYSLFEHPFCVEEKTRR